MMKCPCHPRDIHRRDVLESRTASRSIIVWKWPRKPLSERTRSWMVLFRDWRSRIIPCLSREPLQPSAAYTGCLACPRSRSSGHLSHLPRIMISTIWSERSLLLSGRTSIERRNFRRSAKKFGAMASSPWFACQRFFVPNYGPTNVRHSNWRLPATCFSRPSRLWAVSCESCDSLPCDSRCVLTDSTGLRGGERRGAPEITQPDGGNSSS